eukprot:Hpha_TRINITY_DN20043_c0_g1::TRINITY_DN20043_c0_g1_i1::g.147772::m.147772
MPRESARVPLVFRIVRNTAFSVAPAFLLCILTYSTLSGRLASIDSALHTQRQAHARLEERVFLVEQGLRVRGSGDADGATPAPRLIRAAVKPSGARGEALPLDGGRAAQAQGRAEGEGRVGFPSPQDGRAERKGRVGSTGVGTELLTRSYGLLSPAEFERARADAPAWASAMRYFRHLDDPSRFDPLQGVEWKSDGTLRVPRSQRNPTWPRKEGKRYFEGYTYRKPFRCAGEPYECSGRGVCDYDRGVCVCMPPATGWDCSLRLRPGQSVGGQGELKHEDCEDQTIRAPAVEKWDARAEERCRAGDQSRNGMWLGMTQEASETIARAIAASSGMQAGQTVLDVGMGCGTLTQYIARDLEGLHLAGLDYSAAAIRYVRERLNGTFCVADVRELDFLPDNSVDVAFENGVFSVTREKHCETYRNVYRAVRPGGLFVIMQTRHDWHPVKCWQNIRMQSVELCLGPLGPRMEYVLTRDICDGVYDSYCAGETYTALIRKPH